MHPSWMHAPLDAPHGCTPLSGCTSQMHPCAITLWDRCTHPIELWDGCIPWLHTPTLRCTPWMHPLPHCIVGWMHPWMYPEMPLPICTPQMYLPRCTPCPIALWDGCTPLDAPPGCTPCHIALWDGCLPMPH